jgi:hypothetical protein
MLWLGIGVCRLPFAVCRLPFAVGRLALGVFGSGDCPTGS